MFDSTKKKVGILVETPFLPVSASVKRAIGLARQALVDEGFEVVNVEISPEEYAEGRNILVSMVASGESPAMLRDFESSGEELIFGVWLNF
jgi:Asp-tRNA(Asn)/Glu-tRNA(Gln) amidotransferase A subunit family amidase